MKYINYNESTGKILGYYDPVIHTNIPEPNLEITDKQWQEAIDNNYNYVDVENKTLGKKDFRTIEQIKTSKISELKQIRQSKTDSIVVTISTGEVLNGDETSQDRMNRALSGLSDDTTEIDWIDANNNTIKLTRPKFKEALVLSGQEQTKIFATFNSLREQVNNATDIETVKGIQWTE